MKVEDESGTELGIECGFGLEPFLMGALDSDYALRFSPIVDVVNFQPGLHKKLVEYLETTLIMMDEGIRLGSKGAEQIFRKYVKVVSYLRRRLGIDLQAVNDIAMQYRETIGLSYTDQQVEEVMSFIVSHEKLIVRFEKYCTELAKSQAMLENNSRRLNRTVEYGRRMGIPGVEVKQIMERHNILTNGNEAT
ncbi:MAG TPA: hypothetical protein ENI23_04450 [bacterium]|nr:hypothetical protein [bacterium]